jgi:hypothetical protein
VNIISYSASFQERFAVIMIAAVVIGHAKVPMECILSWGLAHMNSKGSNDTNYLFIDYYCKMNYHC